MHPRKKIVLSAAVGAALLVGAAGASAQSLQVELSGQVNRAIMHADDGIDSDLFNVDNDNSSTRFRFKGTQAINASTKAGVTFEVEYQSNPSNAVSFGGSAGSPSIDERVMELFFQSSWGMVTLGQGDGAANGGVEVDLSGTTVAHYADVAAFGGGIAFRTASGGTGPTRNSTSASAPWLACSNFQRRSTTTAGNGSCCARMKSSALRIGASSCAPRSDSLHTGAYPAARSSSLDWRNGTSSAEARRMTISRLGLARPSSRKLMWRCEQFAASAS